MSLNPTVLAVVFAVLTALFAFQLWSVLRTGHVQWHIGKVHRTHRPVAFAVEVAACGIGLVLFAGLLVAILLHH
jgi:hypothetical protein